MQDVIHIAITSGDIHTTATKLNLGRPVNCPGLYGYHSHRPQEVCMDIFIARPSVTLIGLFIYTMYHVLSFMFQHVIPTAPFHFRGTCIAAISLVK